MDEEDRGIVATIPIQVPLPTFPPQSPEPIPEPEPTPAFEAPALAPVFSDAELLAAFVQRQSAKARPDLGVRATQFTILAKRRCLLWWQRSWRRAWDRAAVAR